jgi:hypothetical protein
MEDFRSRDRSLDSALRAIAAEEEALGTSAAVAARLFVEVHSIARARRRRANLIGVAAAAVLFVGIAVPDWYRSRPSTPATVAPAPATAQDTREVTTAFFPLTYSTVPAPGAHLIRMQVPRSALASYGVTSFDPEGAASPTVLADVVVGDDGLARAVRFVRVVSYFEPVNSSDSAFPESRP